MRSRSLASRLERDNHPFLALTLAVAACLFLLALTVSAALTAGAADHAAGLVTRICQSAGQIAGGTASLSLLSLPLVIGASALVSLLVTGFRTRAHVQSLLHFRSNASSVSDAADAAGLAGKIDVVDAPDVAVFAYGLLRPRVLISTGALIQLTPGELAAVLAHEAHHVARRDPLRLLLSEAASRGLFMFPLIADLKRHFLVANEVAADRRALAAVERVHLASALMKFLGAPRPVALPGIALASENDVRIDHLLRPAEFRLPLEVQRAHVWRTAIAAFAIASVLLALSVALPPML